MGNSPQSALALSLVTVVLSSFFAVLGAFVTSWLVLLREKKFHILRVRTQLHMGTVLPFANYLASIPDGRPLDLVEFDREHLEAYAALALFAPQEFISAYDRNVDFLFDCAEKKQAYAFSRVRDLATTALNNARADLGIKGEIRYLGARRQDTASTM